MRFLLSLACASLAAIGVKLRERDIFGPIRQRVRIGQKTVKYAPTDKLYLAPDQSLSTPERALLLRLTTLFERIVWMVQRYAELLLRNIDPQSQEVVQASPAPAEET